MTETTPSAPDEPKALANVAGVAIEDEMQRSYLDYAMSVIVARALPDARDGLKPVHRRILYAMREGGYDSSKPYKKSARIVGDVMGKYHPHGDSAIYDAMVRMAQDFSMRLELVDGQGNFGSMDGDPPAAMRYTEARLAKAAEVLLEDMDKDTVDFQPNYDESTREPIVLPARFPNLLVNGAGGIAVGMATNLAPHNLGEVCDACIAFIRDPTISLEALMSILPGPDFPTGGIILGRVGCHAAFATGRGSMVVRARTHVEEVRKDRSAIIVTEVPYQVNKQRLIERIAECAQEKIIEGIADLRDESDRDGVRVVIEIKRDAMPDIVLNQLFKHTPLQTSFGAMMLALDRGRPALMTLRDILRSFVAFREDVIRRRTAFELRQARERAHLGIGLAVAVANLDDMIALIRRAANPGVAKQELMDRGWPARDVASLIALVDDTALPEDGTYHLTEAQAKAILDLRLHRLTGLERDKIGADLRALAEKIADLLEILANPERVRTIMVEELTAARDAFATPRRTTIEEQEFETDIEDLIQREDMVVTISCAGYAKRVPLGTYRAQRRGGKGRAGMATREEDAVNDVFVASTHAPVLFFSSRGKAYRLKVYALPLGTPQARGKALVNLLPLEQGETITAILPLPEDSAAWAGRFMVFATAAGTVRRNALTDFENVRQNGLIAMKLEESDRLIAVSACSENDDLLLATRQGRALRCPVSDVRVFAGRTSVGVRGLRLAEGDELISLSILHHQEATAEERAAYLRQASALRRAAGDEIPDDAASPAKDGGADEDETPEGTGLTLSPERFAELAAGEDFILTVSERGFGKRSSAYDYRVTGRGGQGLLNLDITPRTGPVVAARLARPGQDVILVTDSGQIIRTPANQIRVAGRRTQGVTLFRVDDGERVVSVAVLDEDKAAGDVDEGGDVDVAENT